MRLEGPLRHLAAAALLLAAAPAPVAAHGEAPSGPGDLWNHWALEPAVLIGLVAGVALYARGLRRLWARAGTGRVVAPRRAAAFALGIAALLVALVSPLDPLSDVLFSAHMIQHLVLVLIAAPLLVAGAPETVLLWAIGRRARSRVGRAWRRIVHAAGGGDSVAPVRLAAGATALATATLWLWHVPVLYDAAVAREPVHAAEHATFLLTALLFWAGVLGARPRDHLRNGPRVALVFVMAVQGSVLGALITFAERPLYRAHAAIPEAWGIAPLADQQLAGLIMWVPPALLYIAVAAWLFVHWLEAVGRRTRERERRLAAARFGAAGLALVLAACSGGTPQTQRQDDGEPAVTGARMTDAQVAALVQLINGTEASAAKALVPKLSAPATQAYAQELLADHTRLMEAMPAVGPPRVAPLQTVTLRAVFHSQAAMFATLPAGRAFDAVFLATQIVDHAMAIDSLIRWRGLVRQSALRAAITAALPVMESHLAGARALFGTMVPGDSTAVTRFSPGPPADTAAPDTAAAFR